MEFWYQKWPKKWHDDDGKDINNPKVLLSYVRKHGKLLHSSVGENIEDTIS